MINAQMEVSIRCYGNMGQSGRLPGGGDALEKDICGCWSVPTSGEHSGFSVWS